MSTPVADRVLSTLNPDGSRHWLHPRVADGRFWRRRRVVAYTLIALFIALPRIEIGGRPAVLIDLISRELVLFGAVFRPSDGFMLMLLGLTIALTVFLVTALFGRVWCGWGCPQTVYLEYVFRPLDRLFEGNSAQQRALDKAPGIPWRRVAKWAVYAVLAFALANVFLAYFVGRARLEQWVFHSPADHPVGFAVVAVVTALMFFDFAYFREQMCIVTCPYGRLQSVLLDKQSLIVGYDAGRGEPRGKRRKLPVVTDGAPAPAQGDCVDCGACVAVCPTGIDIRNGLQMECVGCAQCIDACDPIMTQTGRPTGLIRYTSEDELAGAPRKLVRPRTLIYPVLITAVVVLLGWASSHRTNADVWVERITGAPFVALADGHVAAAARISLENRAADPRVYTLSLVDAPDATLRAGTTLTLAPGQRVTLPMFVDVPSSSFVDGKRHVTLRVADDAGGARDLVLPLLGPEAGGGA